MRSMLPRLAIAAVLGAGGCAAIIGFPDYGDTATGGSGGSAATGGRDGGASSTAKSTTATASNSSTTTTASVTSSAGTGGAPTACQHGTGCYLGLDGTEGVGPCKGGTLTLDGGVALCDDVRPQLQTCSGATDNAACEGNTGCTGQLRWAESGLPGNVVGVAAGIDGTVAVVGSSAGTPGVFLRTLDARGRACDAAPLVLDDGGTLDPTSVALVGAKRTPDGTVAQLICGECANGRAAKTVIAGHAKGPIDFGPLDGGTGMQAGAGGMDAFLALVDATDKIVWGRLFGSIGNDTANAVTTDPTGAIYVTGSLEGPLTVPPCNGMVDAGTTEASGAYVARVEPDGSCGWVQVFTGNASGTSIAVDSTGRVLLAGTMNGPVHFGGLVLTGTNANPAFIVRLDPDGSVDGALPLNCKLSSPPFIATGAGDDVFGLCAVPAGTGCGDAGTPEETALVHLDPTLTPLPYACFSSTGAVVAAGLATDGAGDVIVLLGSAGPVSSMGFTSPIPVGGIVPFKLVPPYTDYVWASPFGAGTGFGSSYATAVDGMGNVVVASNPMGTVSMPPLALSDGGAVVELAP